VPQEDDATTNNTTKSEGGRRRGHWQWPYARKPKPTRKPKPKGRPYDRALIKALEDSESTPTGKLTINEYSDHLNHAEQNRAHWQRFYYGGRTTVTVTAAAVTALASASAGLSGNAGLGIKISAAVLSFVVAATNGILEVWQVTNRWRLYRVLRNRLWKAGWEHATATAPQELKKFITEVGRALDSFEQQYLMQVLLQTAPGPGPDDESLEEKGKGPGAKKD
jgi:Protein of unknown function (DUF4231)